MIGKFTKLHDEEYIARSFEELGVEVWRVNEKLSSAEIFENIEHFKPDYILWTKLSVGEPQKVRDYCKKYKTICWVFDLYFDYHREHKLRTPAFTADYVFTTDGGHDKEFKMLGINHKCVRQGIYEPECFYEIKYEKENEVIFVGSDNPYNTERNQIIIKLSLSNKYRFKWIGRNSTNEIRGTELNELYSKTKIVIGDSVYSPHYWSNRVVETLGRGGFLIHREVAGIKEAYPYLVTYNGTYEDLCAKIDYYLEHEDERADIISKNIKWVADNYTMDKQCQKLLNYIS